MLTLFACPKAFRGHFAVIQRNAIHSWTLLRPRPEIILFGDDEGVGGAAADFGVRHVPEISRNEFGTPLVSDLFAKARDLSSHQVLAYVNADIILLDDFLPAIERVQRWRSRFLMVGQRTDLHIREPLDFSVPDWSASLRQAAARHGAVRPPNWIDYFVFSPDFVDGLLPFALGRTRWDNYLIWRARVLKLPVVNATQSVSVIHQNHDYSHHAGGERSAWHGVEAERNRLLMGSYLHQYTAADATRRLVSNKIKHNIWHGAPKLGRMSQSAWWTLQHMFRTFVWFPVLRLTRPLRHRFGIRGTAKPQAGEPESLSAAGSPGNR